MNGDGQTVILYGVMITLWALLTAWPAPCCNNPAFAGEGLLGRRGVPGFALAGCVRARELDDGCSLSTPANLPCPSRDLQRSCRRRSATWSTPSTAASRVRGRRGRERETRERLRSRRGGRGRGRLPCAAAGLPPAPADRPSASSLSLFPSAPPFAPPAGAMAACSAPLVGILAEGWFGFRGASTVTGDRSVDLRNAQALGAALLAFTTSEQRRAGQGGAEWSTGCSAGSSLAAAARAAAGPRVAVCTGRRPLLTPSAPLAAPPSSSAAAAQSPGPFASSCTAACTSRTLKIGATRWSARAASSASGTFRGAAPVRGGRGWRQEGCLPV